MNKKVEKTTLKSLGKGDLLPEEMEDFFLELENGSDRAVAIIGAAALESELIRLIETKLVHRDQTTMQLLRDPHGPLSGFYAIIQLSFALGLITEFQKRDLDTIRRIRNVFAHSQKPIKFSNSTIENEIAKLCLGKKFLDLGDAHLIGASARERFVENVLFLSCVFTKSAAQYYKNRVQSFKRRVLRRRALK